MNVIKRQSNQIEPDGHASIGDRTLLFDVTGRSQLAASQQNKPGLLCNAANAKEAKYASMARNQHADFVPFAFGVYGEFEPRAKEFIEFLASRAAGGLEPTFNAERLTRTGMLRTLSLTIQRHNALIIDRWISRNLHFETEELKAASNAASARLFSSVEEHDGLGLFDE